MKILEVISLLLRVRLMSWVTMSSKGAIISNGGTAVVIASYSNGRLIKRTDTPPVPDLVPPGWGPDGPLLPPDHTPPPSE